MLTFLSETEKKNFIKFRKLSQVSGAFIRNSFVSREISRSILIQSSLEGSDATLISREHRLTDWSMTGQRLVDVFSRSMWVAGATAGCQDLSCGNPASCPTFVDRGKRVCFHNARWAITSCDSHVTGWRLDHRGSSCLTGFSSESRRETFAKISDMDVASLVSFPVQETSESLFATERCRSSKRLRIYFALKKNNQINQQIRKASFATK